MVMAARQTLAAARNSQACETCRIQKARCRPSNTQGICEKCLQAGNQCIPHIPKIRSRREKYSRRSLARIEQRIEDLCQRIDVQPTTHRPPLIREQAASSPDSISSSMNQWQIDTANVPSAVPNPGRSERPSQQAHNRESLSTSSSDATLPPLVQVTESFGFRKGNFYGQSLLPSFSPASIERSPGHRLLDKLGPLAEPGAEQVSIVQTLGTGEADQLLANFRSITVHFPIFSLPEGLSCIDCIDHKPFVTLAILLASSSGNARLQAACDCVFRIVLAKKVVVEGKRDLELLQGILIYLAWHHHYLRHDTQQIYQYLQLAIGMVIDLGLNNPTTSTQRPSTSLPQGDLKSRGTSAVAGTAEQERALLGCYTLSCGLAVLSFDKPQNLTYTDYFRRCGEHLAEHGSYETDRDWLPTVQLLHIAEQIQVSSRTEVEGESAPGLLQAHVEDAEQQLQDWKHHNLNQIRGHTRLSLTFHSVQIYLYEKALFRTRPAQSQAALLAGYTSTPTLGAPLLLSSTLRATQAFLDEILFKPASLLRSMNFVEWTQLITAAITLARLARLGPDQARESGLDHMQIKLQVDMYILTLGKRMSDLGVGHVQQDASGLFSWFKAIAQGIKLWVSGPDESGRPEDANAENAARLLHRSVTTASDSVKNLTLHVESNQERPVEVPASTQGFIDATDTAHGSVNPVTLDDHFWDTFVSSWPDTMIPCGMWKG